MKSNLIRIGLIGDHLCGKSSFINTYINQTPTKIYESTIGVDFFRKDVVSQLVNYKFQIWDMSGTERFINIIENYIKTLDVIMIFFDIDNRTSFNNLNHWLELVNKNNNKPGMIKLLIGTKTKDNLRTISMDEILKFSLKETIPYYEVKIDDLNYINKLFLEILVKIKLNVKKGIEYKFIIRKDPNKVNIDKKVICCNIL